jgi:hypothetical protein
LPVAEGDREIADVEKGGVRHEELPG